MGASACSSSSDPAAQEQLRLKKDARIRNRLVDNQLTRWAQDESKQLRLLLLGLPEAGKSTFIRQIMDIYKLTSDEAACRPYAAMITRFCINSLQTLVQQSETLAIEQPALGTLTSAVSIVSVAYIKALAKDTSEITTETAYHMKLLWADQGIQNTFSHRHQFQLSDSARYFLDRIDDIRRPGYIPSEMDLQQRRIGMGSIDEVHFQLKGHPFVLVNAADLAQFSRKVKSMFHQHVFLAVIFVVAVSDYDCVQPDDRKINCLTASMDLFEDLCKFKSYRDTNIILFFNKRDLFKEKITRVPLRDYFPEYTGPNEPTAALSWIRTQFLLRRESGRRVYTHKTCATNADNVEFTFQAVRNAVLNMHLVDVGLMEDDRLTASDFWEKVDAAKFDEPE